MGSPVLPWFSLCTCRRHYPGGIAGCMCRSLPQRWQLSLNKRQVSFHIELFEACSTFTRVTARTLAESLNDPLHRRLHTSRCLPACSDCYRPERPLPEGTCTLSRTIPFHGTRLLRALPGDHRFVDPVIRATRWRLANLTPASGRQNHTASPSAKQRARQSHRLRPPHPAPRT
jgi:hypothetical protein